MVFICCALGCDTNPDKPETGGHDCTAPWVLVGILFAILVSVAVCFYCVWRERYLTGFL
uniref:Uncharacterized protein n=1 Tax=Anguilla anguilla TaxID=7936 RepID=A0A0E9W6F5_ANGAN